MKMGDSNKLISIPYYGRLFRILRAREGHRTENLKAWGTLDTEFPQDTDKSVFLENAYFIDLIGSQIKHELATLATQDTRQALIDNELCFHVHL